MDKLAKAGDKWLCRAKVIIGKQQVLSPKAILFDFDGVLVNTEEQGYYVLSAMLREHGIDYTREEYVELLSGITDESFYEFIRRTHPQLPVPFEDDLKARMDHMIRNNMKAIEGAKDLLQKLKDHKIPFALCSNSGVDNLRLKLKLTGLYDFFAPHIYSRDDTYTPDGIAHPKPEPDMYLLGARMLGVDPRDCMVIEDSVVGTTAGVRAGMTVTGFLGEAHRTASEEKLLTAAGATYTALSMREVWKHIYDFCFKTSVFPYVSQPGVM